jgi:hypothetical protein
MHVVPAQLQLQLLSTVLYCTSSFMMHNCSDTIAFILLVLHKRPIAVPICSTNHCSLRRINVRYCIMQVALADSDVAALA